MKAHTRSENSLESDFVSAVQNYQEPASVELLAAPSHRFCPEPGIEEKYTKIWVKTLKYYKGFTAICPVAVHCVHCCSLYYSTQFSFIYIYLL